MRTTIGIIRRIDDLGRIVIPKEVRERIYGKRDTTGEPMEFYLESNNGLFASENFETAGEPVIQEYSRRKGKDGSEAMTIRKAFPEMIFELYRDDLRARLRIIFINVVRCDARTGLNQTCNT